MVNNYRLRVGASNLKKYAHIFRRAEAEFGVPGPVISAFWGLETDYGAVQGDFDTLNALTTLSYDCRRPELFRPQLIALLKLFDQGVVDASTTGAWAGEIGQTQMLPKDYLSEGTDGDGDGRVDLKHSVPDVIMTTAKFLRDLGWKRGEPWLQEVRLTRDLPWDQAERTNRLPVAQWEQWGVKGRTKPLAAGMKASLILPMGRNGPAFLSYPNYDVFLEWNQSFVYSLTAAYFATRLDGAPRYDPGHPSPGLDEQPDEGAAEKLAAHGYDVGKIDGILGLADARGGAQGAASPRTCRPTHGRPKNFSPGCNHSKPSWFGSRALSRSWMPGHVKAAPVASGMRRTGPLFQMQRENRCPAGYCVGRFVEHRMKVNSSNSMPTAAREHSPERRDGRP